MRNISFHCYLLPLVLSSVLGGCASSAQQGLSSDGSVDSTGLSSQTPQGVKLQWESPRGWVDVNRTQPDAIVVSLDEEGNFRLVDGTGRGIPDVVADDWKCSIFGYSGSTMRNSISWSYDESSVDRTDFKSLWVTYRGQKYTARFLVAPPSSKELVDFEIYAGVSSEFAVGGTAPIEVNTGANSPCNVSMEARYADGTLAGIWSGKGTHKNILNVNYRNTISWTAGKRPGKVTLRAIYRNWQTGEIVKSAPNVVTVMRPKTIVNYATWEQDGDGWKREVNVQTVLEQYSGAIGGVPVRLHIVTPPGITPSASHLDQVKGTSATNGSFTTTQHWTNQPHASFELNDYSVVAEAVQPS